MTGTDRNLVVRGGRLLDPAGNVDRQDDLYIADGRVAAIGAAPPGFGAAEVLDAAGCTVIPGITDLSVHLGSLSYFEQEMAAAIRGGVSTAVLPPDLNPVIDTAAVARLIQERAAGTDGIRVHVLGALTQGLQGSRLTEMHALAAAGCIGMTNLHHPVQDARTLLRCLEYAATCNVPVFLRPVDASLAAGGCAHQGRVATRLGLRGIPHSAETMALSRDLLLVEQVGVRAHFGQVSCARSVELIAEAQGRGVAVSADVSIAHLLFDENALEGFNSLFHVNPPLREPADREVLCAGVREGVLSAICSDHRPHESAAKHAPFAVSEPGIACIESMLGAVLLLVERGQLTLPCAIERLTAGPGRIISPDWLGLETGAPADLCVFRPAARTTLAAEDLRSHGSNNPFCGESLPGAIVATVCGGRISYRNA